MNVLFLFGFHKKMYLIKPLYFHLEMMEIGKFFPLLFFLIYFFKEEQKDETLAQAAHKGCGISIHGTFQFDQTKSQLT